MKQRTYIIMLSILVGLYIFVEVTKPRPLDLSDSFTRVDTIPLGTYILHEQLPVLFPDKEITENTSTLFELRDTIETDSSLRENWIFINASLEFDRQSAEVLLQHVSRGNSAFLSARNFSGILADTLDIATQYLPYYFQDLGIDSTHFVDVSLSTSDESWSMDDRFIPVSFSSIDSSDSDILGHIEGKDVNFIRTRFGDGYIYMHSNPELFGNYIARNPEFREYVFGVLSHLPVRDSMWDEYYKVGRRVASSPLSFVISQKNLKWAWITAVTAILLYLILRSKRVQRIIPEIEAPKNSSIEFAQTIAQLYLEKSSHQAIAEKKIRFFMDQLRQRLGVDTSELDDELSSIVSERSGVPSERVKELMKQIDFIKSQDKITAEQLKTLNNIMETFNRLSLR